MGNPRMLEKSRVAASGNLVVLVVSREERGIKARVWDQCRLFSLWLNLEGDRLTARIIASKPILTVLVVQYYCVGGYVYC